MMETTRTQDETAIVPANLQNWLIRTMLALILLMVFFLGIRAVKESAEIEGVIVYNRQPRGHDDLFVLTYDNLPPVGGIHHNLPQNCGIYSLPIESEKAVHSLEHGTVWITYQPDLAETDITYLQDIVHSQEFLLLSPFPEQRSPIVLTAWGVQLELHSVHDERMEKFIARYRLGPTIPERGSSCADGFGDPLP